MIECRELAGDGKSMNVQNEREGEVIFRTRGVEMMN